MVSTGNLAARPLSGPPGIVGPIPAPATHVDHGLPQTAIGSKGVDEEWTQRLQIHVEHHARRRVVAQGEPGGSEVPVRVLRIHGLLDVEGRQHVLRAEGLVAIEKGSQLGIRQTAREGLGGRCEGNDQRLQRPARPRWGSNPSSARAHGGFVGACDEIGKREHPRG